MVLFEQLGRTPSTCEILKNRRELPWDSKRLRLHQNWKFPSQLPDIAFER
jgi:antitoxin component HigA of HigAB toxin-antitoxin module